MAFCGILLLMSGEKAKYEAQYILTSDKWQSFVYFVKKNPEMKTVELSQHLFQQEYGLSLFHKLSISETGSLVYLLVNSIEA